MADRSSFGFDTTADEVLEGIDLTGRTIVITGGSSGLGAESARAFAAKGAHVVFTARNLEKAEKVAAGIRESTGNANVEVHSLELGNLAKVAASAEALVERLDHIDVLVNNAGVMACPFAKTDDGFEMQFGTNHIGHFLFTHGVRDLLKKGTNVRIVNLSSRGHHIAPVDLDDPNFENREYQKWASYGQSKTANVLFTVALQKRLAGLGIEAFAVHPGGIMTELGRHLTEEDIAMFTSRMDEGTLKLKTVEAGAATQVFAATAPELAGKGGSYLEDCGIAEIDDTRPDGGVRSYAVDEGNADRLWELSKDAARPFL